MAWVVDTCLLIDVAVADPSFGQSSADFLVCHMNDGLVVCPVTYVELAPVFQGDPTAQDHFLASVGVSWAELWTLADSREAHRAWARYVLQKRQQVTPKRPIADILIGAFATRFQGLLTRDCADFRLRFPGLVILEP